MTQAVRLKFKWVVRLGCLAALLGCAQPISSDSILQPTVSSLSPTTGTTAGNTLITIEGAGFAASSTVTIGGAPCLVSVALSTTTVTCLTPASSTAAAVDVVVVNRDFSSGQSLTATLAAAFTYTGGTSSTPTVTSISPAEGPMAGSTVVTMTGTNFNLGSTVSIGGKNCTNLIHLSTTQMSCTTPSVVAGATVDVVVTNRDLSTGITYPGTLASAFTYNPPPTFSSATQGFFMGGTTITVTGTGFRNGATVTINSLSCSSVSVSASTTLTCVAPAGTALASTNIVITNVDGQTVTGTNGFTWRQAAFGTFVDGNGADGIGQDLTKNGKTPSLVSHNGSLIMTWQESNGTADNVRVRRFNGNDSSPTWASLDGGGANGLNADSSLSAQNVRPAVVGTDLWAFWEEVDGMAVRQIRAKRYNGDGSSPLWTFMDGGSLNRSTSKNANTPSPANGSSNLFVGFIENNSTPNTQIRVKRYNAGAWGNFDTGSAENGLNVNPSKNALAPSLTTLAGRLYLAWQETSNTSTETIQVGCNEDETTSAWQYISPAAGLNRDSTHHARVPRLMVFSNKIYAIWVEEDGSAINQVRVARFDGSSCASTSWVMVDGNAANVGINKDSTRVALTPMLGVLSTFLYAVWTESNGAAQNTRAAVLSNEGAGTWTFIDGNGFSGINKSTSQAASNPFILAFGSKLYGTWAESNGTNTTIRVNVAK